MCYHSLAPISHLNNVYFLWRFIFNQRYLFLLLWLGKMWCCVCVCVIDSDGLIEWLAEWMNEWTQMFEQTAKQIEQITTWMEYAYHEKPQAIRTIVRRILFSTVNCNRSSFLELQHGHRIKFHRIQTRREKKKQTKKYTGFCTQPNNHKIVAKAERGVPRLEIVYVDFTECPSHFSVCICRNRPNFMSIVMFTMRSSIDGFQATHQIAYCNRWLE